MKQTQRRNFLVIGVLAGVLGFAVMALVKRAWQDADCRNLGNVVRFPDNSVSYVACARVYVVHGLGEDVAVYLAEAPHLPHEPLRYERSRHRFVGLHGEAFDVRGLPLKGPAQRPLFRCPTTTEDGNLVVEAESSDPAAIRAACIG